MKIVFIILLLSIILAVLFIPRYPIECYSSSEVGKANDWGGTPKTEADYEKMHVEISELKEQLRKKDDVLKDRAKEAERSCRDITQTLEKRSSELEKNEEEARKQKDECEKKSITCIQDALTAERKQQQAEAKLKSAEECCDKQKSAGQEASQQINTLQNEIGVLKLRIETLTGELKNAEASVNILKNQKTPQ